MWSVTFECTGGTYFNRSKAVSEDADSAVSARFEAVRFDAGRTGSTRFGGLTFDEWTRRAFGQV
ncbi:hypothetical protein [Haloprofundus halophilus]|uniref:hypothetical protein n=1 Tax=Haloprofundus halophilus TaxID=2283527 RepID=UPI0013002020|nr:hypothetical protein [Haloprofundus halophilus]